MKSLFKRGGIVPLKDGETVVKKEEPGFQLVGIQYIGNAGMQIHTVGHGYESTAFGQRVKGKITALGLQQDSLRLILDSGQIVEVSGIRVITKIWEQPAPVAGPEFVDPDTLRRE